jgi:hypothetical protein
LFAGGPPKLEAGESYGFDAEWALKVLLFPDRLANLRRK